MRLARYLFIFMAMAFAALALTAATATAQIEFLDEETDQHCPALVVVEHSVGGGCHVEYESEGHIPLVAYIPGPVVISNCNVHLEARIGEDGAGYITQALLTNEPVPPNPPCTREPCDEPAPGHEDLLWPLQLEENGPGQESIETEFCLRVANSAGGVEGGASARCEVHLPFTHVLSHDHELGDDAEYFCEVSPIPAPVSIQRVHFVNENPASGSNEDIYFVH